MFKLISRGMVWGYIDIVYILYYTSDEDDEDDDDDDDDDDEEEEEESPVKVCWIRFL